MTQSSAQFVVFDKKSFMVNRLFFHFIRSFDVIWHDFLTRVLANASKFQKLIVSFERLSI